MDENGLVVTSPNDFPDSDWNIRELGDVGEHPSFDELADAIERSTLRGRDLAALHVNADSLAAYWNNGRMIVTYEQGGRDRAEYGDKTLKRLSKRLTGRLGRGFSRSNLQYMRLLYLKHPICQTLSGKLSFSHYCASC